MADGYVWTFSKFTSISFLFSSKSWGCSFAMALLPHLPMFFPCICLAHLPCLSSVLQATPERPSLDSLWKKGIVVRHLVGTQQYLLNEWWSYNSLHGSRTPAENAWSIKVWCGSRSTPRCFIEMHDRGSCPRSMELPYLIRSQVIYMHIKICTQSCTEFFMYTLRCTKNTYVYYSCFYIPSNVIL